MSGDTWAFIAALVLVSALIFLMVHFIIMFADLESDYVNPIDLCKTLNPVRRLPAECRERSALTLRSQRVKPEVATIILLVTVFIVTGNYGSATLNAPVLAWTLWRCVPAPRQQVRCRLLTEMCMEESSTSARSLMPPRFSVTCRGIAWRRLPRAASICCASSSISTGG
jgi:hypothetical protein